MADQDRERELMYEGMVRAKATAASLEKEVIKWKGRHAPEIEELARRNESLVARSRELAGAAEAASVASLRHKADEQEEARNAAAHANSAIKWEVAARQWEIESEERKATVAELEWLYESKSSYLLNEEIAFQSAAQKVTEWESTAAQAMLAETTLAEEASATEFMWQGRLAHAVESAEMEIQEGHTKFELQQAELQRVQADLIETAKMTQDQWQCIEQQQELQRRSAAEAAEELSDARGTLAEVTHRVMAVEEREAAARSENQAAQLSLSRELANAMATLSDTSEALAASRAREATVRALADSEAAQARLEADTVQALRRQEIEEDVDPRLRAAEQEIASLNNQVLSLGGRICRLGSVRDALERRCAEMEAAQAGGLQRTTTKGKRAEDVVAVRTPSAPRTPRSGDTAPLPPVQIRGRIQSGSSRTAR
mmetsp:Transcript_77466/g.177393  ORF Transcript_77466/g.177393 Transcript_77466/m.177393 type:complete len:429 (-) Transcript_77466:196-1482(-)